MARTNYTDRLNKLCAEKGWTSQFKDISPEAHGDDPCDLFRLGKDPKRSQWYKTEMCHNMTETGHCSYNETGHCVFAHSEEEKRPMPTLLRNWKFKLSIIDGIKRIKSVENDQTHRSKKFAQEEAIRALLQLLDDDERRREEPAAGPPPSASSAKDFPGLHNSSPATAPRQSASVNASPSDLPGLGASASAAPGQSAWASGPPTALKTPVPQAVVWPSLATKRAKPLPPLPPLGAWARTTAPAPGECHEAAAAQEESEAAARAEQPEDTRSCSSQLSTPTSTSSASTVLDEAQFAQDGELDKDAEIERLKKEIERLKKDERIRVAKLENDNQVLREKVEALQGATDAVQPTQNTPEGSSGSPRSSGSHGKARHERSPSIKERGWTKKREKNHYILSRWAIVEDQETQQLKLEKQTETVSKTPSDRRSSLNCEASFKRDDWGVKAFVTSGADRDAIERKLGEINSAQERASQLNEEAGKAEVEMDEVERKLSGLLQRSAQQEDFISKSWSELESDASVVRLCL